MLKLTLEDLQSYVSSLFGGQGDLALFGPELILVGTIVVMLVGRLFVTRVHMNIVALVGVALASWCAV